MGLYLDSHAGKAFLPKDCFATFASLITRLLYRLSLLEHIAACTAITLYAHLYMRCLQLWLSLEYDPQKEHLNKWVLLPPTVPSSLTWWCNPSKVMAGISFNPPTSHATLTTDASLVGWVAHIQGHTVQGLCSVREAWMHIHFLELHEVQHACQMLLPFIQSRHIQLLSDNMTAIVYINKQGSARSRTLCREAIWNWCLRHLVLHTTLLSGMDNNLADTLSCSFHINHEWELHDSTLRSVFH